MVRSDSDQLFRNMDFRELLNVADSNKKEATYEASIKRYTSNLPPPKKLPKSNVLSGGVKAFLAKQQAEREQREAEARRKKEELLALRAQNTKSNKKAKIMASRTKDNDFSKIKLTDDEIEARKKREYELMRQNLQGKFERMKARIELEEKEKLLPKKRKRKSKHSEGDEGEMHPEPSVNYSDPKPEKNRLDKNKPKPRPPPSMSFEELIKIAEKKQFEPLELRPQKKEEEKLLTKKEKRLLEEERARIRRKEEMEQERLVNQLSMKPSSRIPKKNIPSKVQKSVDSKKPIVVHVEKSVSKPIDESKIKISKNNGDIIKNIQNNKVDSNKLKVSDKAIVKKPGDKSVNTNSDRLKKPDLNSVDKNDALKKKSLPSKANGKIAPVNWTAPTSNKPSNALLDIAKMEEEMRKKFEADLEEKLAKLAEEKLKKKLEEEYEKKFAARLADIQKSVEETKVTEKKPPEKSKLTSVPQKTQPPPPNKTAPPPMSRKEYEKIMAAKKAAAAPKPQKKQFHFNPYLDAPRRLLEPIRSSKPPPKRRLESSDEDEDDDDDDDFIDRSESQNDEDYSKYIKEIFGYDKNRYADIDDDDIIESSFSQVQKEEMISAKLGHLEDLEEERKLREMEKRKKKNKKR